MQIVSVLFFFGVLGAFDCLAQSTIQLTDWETYSSLQSVRQASVDSKGRIWCATSGGVFRFDPESGESLVFRNINALFNLDVTTVRCDPASQSVLVGCFDGSFEIVSEDGAFTSISEIRRASQYQRRAVNDAATDGSRIYIATDFGIAVYDRVRNVFIETIDRIGPLQGNTPVYSVAVFDNSLWAATDSGLVVAPLDVPTHRLPSVWTRFDADAGLPPGPVKYFTTDNGLLFTTSASTVYRITNKLATVAFQTADPILGLDAGPNGPTASTINGVFDVSGHLPIQSVSPLVGHTTYSVRPLKIVALLADRGVAIATSETTTPVQLNSPNTRQFVSLTIDGKGRLWAASYNEAARTGQGLAVFENGIWTNINSSTFPGVPTDNAYRVSTLSDGSVFAGVWGGGGIIAKDITGTTDLVRITPSVAAVIGIAADTNFVLVADASSDRFGNTWVVNEQALDRVLVRIAPDGKSDAFRNCTDVRSNLFRSLAIDNANTKWVGSPFGLGLLAYNERNTPDNLSDDVCVRLTSSNSNLPDNVVSTVRTDLNGAIWVGTTRGVAVIASPGAVSNTTTPFVRRISVLGAVIVNDIAIDALNYKWVATSNGVFVLNEDGTEVLATIAAGRSPLISDNVRSITTDPASGKVWFGTTEGLSSARSQSIRPLSSYSIQCYPQPFVPGSTSLTIDGLAPDSDVRILTSNGHTVAAVQTRGRQALWDGRDASGLVVTPGVYVIHARSSSDQGAAVAKIVVTR